MSDGSIDNGATPDVVLVVVLLNALRSQVYVVHYHSLLGRKLPPALDTYYFTNARAPRCRLSEAWPCVALWYSLDSIGYVAQDYPRLSLERSPP
eukprot:12405450-Karenia_brevis.AAC.1